MTVVRERMPSSLCVDFLAISEYNTLPEHFNFSVCQVRSATASSLINREAYPRPRWAGSVKTLATPCMIVSVSSPSLVLRNARLRKLSHAHKIGRWPGGRFLSTRIQIVIPRSLARGTVVKNVDSSRY